MERSALRHITKMILLQSCCGTGDFVAAHKMMFLQRTDCMQSCETLSYQIVVLIKNEQMQWHVLTCSTQSARWIFALCMRHIKLFLAAPSLHTVCLALQKHIFSPIVSSCSAPRLAWLRTFRCRDMYWIAQHRAHAEQLRSAYSTLNYFLRHLNYTRIVSLCTTLSAAWLRTCTCHMCRMHHGIS